MHTTIFCFLSLVASSWAIGDWRPVGQEDPLNDPTNVYSPPQIAHVHYWLRAPSFDLEPPPTRATELSQVAGWPQISSHFQPIHRPDPTTTTPVSITTQAWLAAHNTPPPFSALPTWPSPFQITSDPFSTEPPITLPPIFHPHPQVTTLSSTWSTAPTTTATERMTTATPSTLSTSSSTHPPPPPVSFVIEGHSKVKTYGPLPETSDSIHSINHNHLTSTKKQTIFDLFNF